jgi:hypothetical protein
MQKIHLRAGAGCAMRQIPEPSPRAPESGGAALGPKRSRRERAAPMSTINSKFRKTFRTVVAAIAGVAIAGPALANACLRPEERGALDVRALQTYLMVTALNCQKGESYNQFIRRFGNELSSANRVTNAYFTRAYGGQARTRFDSNNTNMANEHSEDAIRAGSFFCRDADPLFQRALATPGPQLAEFAALRNIPQSVTAPECPAGGTPARQASARRR